MGNKKLLAAVVAVSGAFATATVIPTLAVKKRLHHTQKRLAEKKTKHQGWRKKKYLESRKNAPRIFFFARTSLIKLKKMGAVEVFFENIKKDGCSGSLFLKSISP